MNMKNKILFIFILAIYILLPILILYNPILFQYKFYILTVFGLLIYILLRVNYVSNKDLGISKENILKSLKRNIPIVLLFIVIIIIFRIYNLNKYTPTETIYFYLFYIFISCPIQEFLYRGIFGYFENSSIKNKYITVLLSSFCYAFVHIIYKDLLTCFLTFIFGIVLYLLYRKDYNLLGVSVTHIILGILTIYLGIVN